jgi:hypothetical protein
MVNARGEVALFLYCSTGQTANDLNRCSDSSLRYQTHIHFRLALLPCLTSSRIQSLFQVYIAARSPTIASPRLRPAPALCNGAAPVLSATDADPVREEVLVASPEDVAKPDGHEGMVFTLMFWILHSWEANFVVAVKSISLC